MIKRRPAPGGGPTTGQSEREVLQPLGKLHGFICGTRKKLAVGETSGAGRPMLSRPLESKLLTFCARDLMLANLGYEPNNSRHFNSLQDEGGSLKPCKEGLETIFGQLKDRRVFVVSSGRGSAVGRKLSLRIIITPWHPALTVQ
jgi:hypothetical protein